MNLYDYAQAFGAGEKTSRAMRRAIREWFSLYYRDRADEKQDPCQRIAYTIVEKLTKTVFAEYQAACNGAFYPRVLEGLDAVRSEAVQLALIGGESYLKPCPEKGGFSFQLIPRDRILIFGRDSRGQVTDVGTAEVSARGSFYYTLLERRQVDAQGYLTIQNRLFRARSAEVLGQEVALSEHPLYAQLPPRHTYAAPVGSVGLVRLRTPMVNCVDGSADGVSVYAAAAGLIRAIDRNEALLSGEFERGQSRVIVSRDMLRDGQLLENVFVGLDEAPEQVGITVYAPPLREQAYHARKQEYLRNVESVIGLKRGLLSDANAEDRTATEISASQGEYNLTVMGLQRMWETGLREALALCGTLAQTFGMGVQEPPQLSVDWGNGVLYDEDKLWQDYLGMVDRGLLKPELALAWRFGCKAESAEALAAVRRKYMPEDPAVQ